MNRTKNSQSIQINGSSGVSIGDIHQTVGLPSGEGKRCTQLQPIKVLFLAANPSRIDPLHLDREVKMIDQALRSSALGDRFELEQGWAVGDRDLQDGLLRYHPEIVHLSCHGREDGKLIFEKDPMARGVSSPGTGATAEGAFIRGLASLFAVTRGGIRCVVLSACHSEGAARALAEHVDCVVGMAAALQDSAAIRFSWAFYNALGYGQSVKAAFELGRAQLALGEYGQEKVPSLFAQRVDPATVVFGRDEP